MLQKTSCHHILTTRASLAPLLTSITSLIASDFTLLIEEIPTLVYCYPHLGKETHSDPFVLYPVSKSPRDMDDVILYLHSSGSTGFPKAIPQTNRTVLHWYSLGIFLHFSLNTNTDIFIYLYYRLYNRLSPPPSPYCRNASSFLPHAWNLHATLCAPRFCFFSICLSAHIFHGAYRSSSHTYKR
jgi:acyl-CoA synthetase (AMP-forming)/AMP-acid ligase II